MKKIAVIDLDGSLIRINSFRYWMFFASLFLFFTLRWALFLRFFKYVACRLMGLSDRVAMKRGILSVTEKLPDYFIVWFVWFLCRFVNRNVLAEMGKFEESNYYVDLCTAAPLCYSEKLGRKLNFSHVFATPFTDASDWKENIGDQKLISLVTFYGEQMDVECVITDHYDDLPLLAIAKNRFLVRPARITRDRVSGLFSYNTIL